MGAELRSSPEVRIKKYVPAYRTLRSRKGTEDSIGIRQDEDPAGVEEHGRRGPS